MSDNSPALRPNTPTSEVSRIRARARKWLILMILSVVGIVLPPVIGLSGTVFGMISAFDETQMTGGSDPEVIAGDVSGALASTAVGIFIALLSGVAFIIFLTFWLTTLGQLKNAPENLSA